MRKDCPVDILQYGWEFDIILDLYKRTKPKIVLEIGSLYGGTIFHWLKEADWDVTVISVDLFSTTDYEKTRKTWDSWVATNQFLFSIKGDSSSPNTVDAIKTITSGIDWLFIDGDHTYEGAKKDHDNYYPLLNKDGYCILHDIVGEGGVCKLWNEIKNDDRPKIEICHSKYHLGIGVIQNWKKE